MEHIDKFFSRRLPNEEKWSKRYDVFDLKLPRRIWSKKGKRILFVLDLVPNEDIREGLLLSGGYGETLNNIIDDIQERNDYPIAEYAAINLHCFRIAQLSSKIKERAKRDFRKRIVSFIDKYDPDCVVFLGQESSRLVPFNENFEPNYDVGRVHEATIENSDKKYKYIPSLSLDVVATNIKDNYGKYPNLLGFSYRHIELAVLGKNRYNIQKKVEGTEKVLIDTVEKFDSFLSMLRDANIVSLDTEGINPNRIENRLLSLQICLDGKKGYFLPLYHADTPFSSSELEYVGNKLKEYFEFGTSRFHVWHNAKYDVTQIRVQLGVRFYAHNVYDTMAGEYNLDENRKFLSSINMRPYRLDILEAQYGYRRPDLAIGKDDRGNLNQYSLEDVFEYGTIDAITPYWIVRCQLKEAKRRGIGKDRFIRTVTELNNSQIHSFVEMEINGTPIDRSYLMKMRARNSEFNKTIDKVNEDLKKSKAARKANKKLLKQQGAPTSGKSLFGNDQVQWTFRINKPLHKHVLFHDVLQLEGNITKDGKISTNAAFKKQYKDSVPEVKMLDDYDKNVKLKTTFIDGTHKILMNDPDAQTDGRLRANYKFIDVITGRAAASDPNLQQIPSRGDLAKLIKRMFIAHPYHILVDADYSAHEVRMWGNIARDKKIVEAFSKGYHLRRKMRLSKRNNRTKYKSRIMTEGDIHRINFKFFFGRFPKDKNERNGVKSVVFGTIYGQGAKSLSEAVDNSAKINQLEEEIDDIKKELEKR